VNGAEILIRTLIDAGLDVCFANPGTTELPIVRALDEVGRMRAVLCLHDDRRPARRRDSSRTSQHAWTARGGDSMQQTETVSPSDLTTLLALNQDDIRSVQSSDVQRFKEILADDFLCSLPDGSLIDRERFLEQTARPVQISNLQAHDVNVRLMGDVAIIDARTTYPGPDGRAGSGRYTDVWARRQGRWLAVSAHVTRN
jgi:hypothetical protein